MPRPLVLLLAVAGALAPAAENERPDILVIFADDLAPDTIAALGNREIKTPNLDRLAARGTSFDRTYGMGGWTGAICVASRAMLLTGRTMWKCGNGKAVETDAKAGRLLPQRLAAAGYRTYFTGKWHNGSHPTEAFQETGVLRINGMPKTGADAYLRTGAPGEAWRPDDPARGGYWQGGKHWSEVTADDVIARLGKRDPDGKPLLVFAAFNAPHDPRQAPKAFLDLYPRDKMSVPANFLPAHPFAKAIGCGPELRDEKLTTHPRTREAIQLHRSEYYAIISHLDAQVGRILDALEKSGRADRTLVVFTADNGLAVGSHGLMGKQSMYEHSLRVPLVVAGPGVAAGRRVATPVHLFDVTPTLLELGKADAATGFLSLAAALRGGDAPARDGLIGGYLNLQRTVIQGDWKLIAYPKAGVVRLYNVAADPLEMKDLAADPAQAGRRRELFRLLVDLQTRHDDKLDLTDLGKTL